MDEMIKELSIVEALLGSMPVTYDAQDTVVVAKSKIRRVKAELEQMKALQGKECVDGQTD